MRQKTSPAAAHDALHQVSVSQPLTVFRFVRVDAIDDSRLIDDFRSDKERGKRFVGRSARISELRDGLSAFRSLELARRRWVDIEVRVHERHPAGKVKLGDHVAALLLDPGPSDFQYEDLGHDDGHMTIWGSPVNLAAAVFEIVPAKV
jgi:hypothetical protein